MTTENTSDAAQHDSARPHDSRQIANFFIRLARSRRGRGPSITQLIKLVYMAHGWTLALRGRPLVNEQIEAWKHGPVLPSVYYAFRPQGTYDLQPNSIYDDEFDDDMEALLEQVYDLYGNLSPVELSRLTHIKDGPWYKSYRGGNSYSPIPDDLIAEHYRDKWNRAQERARERSTST